MEMIKFADQLKGMGVSFFAGVPDSQLKELCNYLIHTYGISNQHIIAANEGNAVALAAGYHLATGQVPCVYLQNSGLGNVINPVASLLNEKVYGIPCVFVVGWRGEPKVKDEPQHVFQGEVTESLLEVMGIPHCIIDKNTTDADLEQTIAAFKTQLQEGKSVALLVRKDALTYDVKVKYKNSYPSMREEIINSVVDYAGEDIIVSTTGKTSRELFEIREQRGQSHKYDFLTVGSMGHSSSIALSIALNKPGTRVWCVDGDGAALMHMGAMGVIAANAPDNFIHVVINNEAHESVGGQPTVARTIDLTKIALGCGYKAAWSAADLDQLKEVLPQATSQPGPVLIEVKCAIGSRDDLGRPTTTPVQNKQAFMEYLKNC